MQNKGFQLELQRLKAKHESQSQLLESIEEMGDHMNDVLRQAAPREDMIMMKRLLSRGVRVNMPDETGVTAFMYACGQGHTEIAELMISVHDAIVKDTDAKLTPLILASTNSQKWNHR